MTGRGKTNRTDDIRDSEQSTTDATPITGDADIARNDENFAAADVRYDLQILKSIRRVIRAVDIHSRKLKADYQLTAPQLICLKSIIDKGHTTTSQIAQDVFLSPSTVVGILDRLEQRGLISRDRNAKDRRIVNVAATEKGKRVGKNAPSALQKSLAEALQQLPQLEQATIALSLERIVNLMETGHLEADFILDANHTESAASDEGSGALSGEPER